jgi:hypothetical protein
MRINDGTRIAQANRDIAHKPRGILPRYDMAWSGYSCFCLRLVLAAVALLGPASGQQLRFNTLTRDAIVERLKEYGGSDWDRETRLKQLFHASGCPDTELSEQVVSPRYAPNLMCVLPGQSGAVIVIGAHFDHVDSGDGVVDNWSGASLLPSFLITLTREPRHHRFVLIAFTGEEEGMRGSEFYVRHLSPEQRGQIQAVINLDTLGLGPTEVWVTHSDPRLSGTLNGVAHAMNLPLAGMNVDYVGSTDSEPFAHYHIPRMTVHSLTQQTLTILHSPRDKFDAIHLDDYYGTYRLLSAYFVYLDGFLGQTAPPTTTHATK